MKSVKIYPYHVPKISIYNTTASRAIILVVIGLMFFFALPIEAFAITPIAHTDVVPYQRIKNGTSFNFGVVAFSKPGIDRVHFAIAGQGYAGGAKTSTNMTLNARVASAEYNGVWEYFVTISASEFTGNGPITVTPTVYDNSGNTRALDPVTMIVEGASTNFDQRKAWVDPSRPDGSGTVGNSNDPFPNIQSAVSAAQTANGGTSSGNIIYLNEGTYSISGLTASTSGEWLTIAKAAGANRNNVIINEGRPNAAARLRFDNITFQSQGDNQEVLFVSNGSAHYWTNSCRIMGSGRTATRSSPIFAIYQNISATGSYYSTNDYTYDVYDAYQSCKLIRGAVVEQIGGDAFKNYQCVINAKVNDMTNGIDDTYHFDVLQVYQVNPGHIDVENRLAYNVYATDIHYQGIMRSDSTGADASNNAYINVFIEMRDPGENGGAGYRQLMNALGNEPDDHLLVWHCSFPYGHTSWSGSPTNSSFIGNLFWQETHRLAQYPIDPTTDWLYNHFMHVVNMTPTCTGTSIFIDQDWPCPHWYASIKDTGSSTASYGDGVVDISTPGATDFGYPTTGSTLIDALSSKYVPCDVFGHPRDHRPDIGALEYPSDELLPPARPTGLEIVSAETLSML